ITPPVEQKWIVGQDRLCYSQIRILPPQRGHLMKAMVIRTPGGLEHIEQVEHADPGQPAAGQIRVALHASSLHFHDLLVANGAIPTVDGRILMADGAGLVEAVGEGVTEFTPGDSVVSCFFPGWLAGPPTPQVCSFETTPGD